MPQLNEIFIRSMREIRKSEQITQVDLAARVSEALGYAIDGSAITRIEKGQRPLRLDEAAAIATALGMRMQDMLPSELTLEEQIAELERDEAQAHAELNKLDHAYQEARASLTVLELRLSELRSELDAESQS